MYDNYLVLEQIPAHLRVDLDLNVSIMENLAWLDLGFFKNNGLNMLFKKNNF